MPTTNDLDLLDRFALHTATLIVNPTREVRAALLRDLADYRNCKRHGALTVDHSPCDLAAAVDAAEAAARERPGYRADLEG